MSSPGQLRGNTAAMVEGALCIALAVVLSRFNLFEMPQGGSVDLELVPLLLFAWQRGLKWGMAVGALTGVVKLLMGAHMYYPLQAVLDYPLAYAMAGLAALFSRRKTAGQVAGVVAACAAQTFWHVISGVVYFAQYAPEGQSPWVYSTVYNVGVMTPKYVLSGVAAWLLWRALDRVLPAKGDS